MKLFNTLTNFEYQDKVFLLAILPYFSVVIIYFVPYTSLPTNGLL